MERCPACGGELGKENRFCPHCGNPIPERETEKPRDYWAQRLSPQEEDGEPEELTEEEDLPEDWLEEIPEEELTAEDPDLADSPRQVAWSGPMNVWDDLEKEKNQKKQRRKRIIWSIVLFLLALALLGTVLWLLQPEQGPEIPGTGRYLGQYTTYKNTTVDARADYAELGRDGICHLELMGTHIMGYWELEGESITCQGRNSGIRIFGTLCDGVLSLRYQEVTYVLALPESQDRVHWPMETEPEATTAPLPKADYTGWAGDYYGLMAVSEGRGTWEDLELACWDICGQIQLTGEDRGEISLWTRENKPGARLCAASVIFLPGTTEAGKMEMDWGKFHGMELREGEWVVDPGKSPVSHIPGMLCISGRFTDPYDPASGFTYEIFLRPWGETWEDVEEMDPALLPISPMLPEGYRDWYLPLIQGGMQMPENF